MRAAQTIFLCDDDAGVRNSLSFLCRQHGFVVSAHASGPELLSAIDAMASPVRGVFVLDVTMEPMSGPQVHEQLRARGLGKRNPVIFLSAHGDVPIVVAALTKGALNFVEKPHTDGTLLPLIREALALEEIWQSQARRAELLQSLWGSLSLQQKRVALLVAEGKLNKVIASLLDVSERTVEVHRSKVFEKMGVDSAAALATTIADLRACGISIAVDGESQA